MLARRMLARALQANVPAAWCTADEFYGGDRHLRRDLQRGGVGYVLAVAKNHRVIALAADGPVRADRLAAGLPQPGVEPPVRWGRFEGRPGLRLGLDRHHRTR